jgi:hypothetical protein
MGSLSTIATLIAGFSILLLTLRIHGMLNVEYQHSRRPMAWNEGLLIFATVVAFGLGLLPFTLGFSGNAAAERLSAAACSAAVVWIIGYTVAVPIHEGVLLRHWLRLGADRYLSIETIVGVLALIAGVVASYVAYTH